jgi:hypothetical protein
VPACSGSTRPASGPWPAPRPRTCATPCPGSTSRPCWSTAARTCASLAVAEDLNTAIPGSTLVVLPRAGRVCNIEVPEAFNQAVRSFLQSSGGRRPGR